MKKQIVKKASRFLIALLFWLTVWELSALIVDLEFIFPRISNTFCALLQLIFTKEFWISIILSLLRIIYGLILGVIIGIIAAFICNKYKFGEAIISPAMTVIKSTPVASVIMLLWFIIGSKSVPIAIALLMVTPIIWQNVLDGFNAIEKDLSEVCDVFRFSAFKRLRILTIPTLTRFLLPAIATASGLAWKSGVAAEIITYTEKSIGKEIIDAKNGFDGAEMFALTLCVIVLSVLIEKIIKVSVKAVINQ